MNSTFVYSDLNQRTPDRVPLAVDYDAVLQAVNNLFRTAPGDRLFRPAYGTNLLHLLHKPVDDITAARIESILVNAIHQNEPRVEVVSSVTRVTPIPERLMYDIVIAYRVLGFDPEDDLRYLAGALRTPS